MKKSCCKFTVSVAVSVLCAATVGLASYAGPHHGGGGGGGGGGNRGGGQAHPVMEHHQEMMQRREERREDFRRAMEEHRNGGFGHEEGRRAWEHHDWEHHDWEHGGFNHSSRPEENGVQSFNWHQNAMSGSTGQNWNSGNQHPFNANFTPTTTGTTTGATAGTTGGYSGHWYPGAGSQIPNHLPNWQSSNNNSSRSNGFNIDPVGGSTTSAGSSSGTGSTGGNNNWQNFAEHHPRRAEVLSRDNNLNKEIQADKGNLGGNYNKLEREDQAIRQQEQADARFNGGYITKGEQRQLNHEENELQHQINRDDHNPTANNQPGTHNTSPGTGTVGTGTNTASGSNGSNWQNFAEEHPRRAEVLSRDNSLNNELQADKGNLGGNYSKLEREDQAIKQQEQADARFNGGYITQGEQRQLNHEENELQRQINRDDHPTTNNQVGTTTGSQSSVSSANNAINNWQRGNWNKFREHHPRRAEVLSRDNHLNNELQADKGNLGGNYSKLEREDQAIKQQEQADARFNGGYITKGEQRQLNHEENELQRQINRDDHGHAPQGSSGNTGSSGSSGNTSSGSSSPSGGSGSNTGSGSASPSGPGSS